MSNITNVTDFLKPIDINPENKLTGVVTPYDQKFNRKTNDGFKLIEIFNNESLLKRFDRFVFPDFQIMSNGDIFISPVKVVMQTMHKYYIKWMFLDEYFTPLHDNDYQYANMPKTGYLVKVVIPVVSQDEFMDFSIEYLCDINNILTYSSDHINKLDTDNKDNIEIGVTEDLIIESYDPSKYPKFSFRDITEKREFYNKYLLNIFD